MQVDARVMAAHDAQHVRGAVHRGESLRSRGTRALERQRPPSGGTYSPLGNQDVVWLSMKRDTAPPPRFAKKPPKVHVYEVASRRSW